MGAEPPHGDPAQLAYSAAISLKVSIARQQCFPHQRRADISCEMQQGFGQFVLGPALIAREPQVQLEFRIPPLRRIGNNADQRSGFQIKPRPRP